MTIDLALSAISGDPQPQTSSISRRFGGRDEKRHGSAARAPSTPRSGGSMLPRAATRHTDLAEMVDGQS